MIDTLVGAGANDIGGINFMVSQASKLLDDAREQAIADARRKAEIYAKAAGVTLGAPLSISEEGAPGPMFRGKMAAPMAARRTGGAGRRDAVGDGERVLGDQAGAVDVAVIASACEATIASVPGWNGLLRIASRPRNDGLNLHHLPRLQRHKPLARNLRFIERLTAAPCTGASIASSVSWNVP